MSGNARLRNRLVDSPEALAEQFRVRRWETRHQAFPGFQFLPVPTRIAISRRWPFVHTPSSEFDAELDAVLSVELVGLTEFRHLFPASVLHRERLAGLTKSLVAVKGAAPGWSP